MALRSGDVDPALDIQGVVGVSNTRDLIQEASDKGVADVNGVGDAISAPVSSVQTLTDAAGLFTGALIGHFIVISGATNGTNNGEFLVTGNPSATTLEYVNSAGVVEGSFTGTWAVAAPLSLADHVEFDATDRKNIKGTASHTSDNPVYQRPDAVGTDVPTTLTNIAGKTLDALPRVINEEVLGIRPFWAGLSPSGTVSYTTGSQTVTTTGFGYTPDMVGTHLFFATATDATILGQDYIIKQVVDAQTIVLYDDFSPAANGTGTLTHRSDRYTFPMTVRHADAVNTLGIPIANGADSTNYEAVYAQLMRRTTKAGVTNTFLSHPADLFARSQNPVANNGSSDTPNSTKLITLFFYAGDPLDPSPPQEALIGGLDSFSTGTVFAGGNNNVSGYTGITDRVIGMYLQTGNSTVSADNVGRFQITSVVSDTEFIVNAPANFVAESGFNSAIRPVAPDMDVYLGNRVKQVDVPETNDRVFLVNGVTTDAILQGDTGRLRSFVGAGVLDENPVFDNTGTNYMLGLAANPALSDLEEAVNLLNDEVGDRNYTGGVLTAGETITASLQALSDALGTATILRIIERLTSTVPKNTAHTIPGGNTYTLDGTDNGANMYVHWNGLLRDPGPNTVSSNSYEETSTTQITPYVKLPTNSAVNYWILQ